MAFDVNSLGGKLIDNQELAKLIGKGGGSAGYDVEDIYHYVIRDGSMTVENRRGGYFPEPIEGTITEPSYHVNGVFILDGKEYLCVIGEDHTIIVFGELVNPAFSFTFDGVVNIKLLKYFKSMVGDISEDESKTLPCSCYFLERKVTVDLDFRRAVSESSSYPVYPFRSNECVAYPRVSFEAGTAGEVRYIIPFNGLGREDLKDVNYMTLSAYGNGFIFGRIDFTFGPFFVDGYASVYNPAQNKKLADVLPRMNCWHVGEEQYIKGFEEYNVNSHAYWGLMKTDGVKRNGDEHFPNGFYGYNTRADEEYGDYPRPVGGVMGTDVRTWTFEGVKINNTYKSLNDSDVERLVIDEDEGVALIYYFNYADIPVSLVITTTISGNTWELFLQSENMLDEEDKEFTLELSVSKDVFKGCFGIPED